MCSLCDEFKDLSTISVDTRFFKYDKYHSGMFSLFLFEKNIVIDNILDLSWSFFFYKSVK
jgi:hypothetical protein